MIDMYTISIACFHKSAPGDRLYVTVPLLSMSYGIEKFSNFPRSHSHVYDMTEIRIVEMGSVFFLRGEREASEKVSHKSTETIKIKLKFYFCKGQSES